MKISETRIQAKLTELGQHWVLGDGLHALTSVTVSDTSEIVFYPAKGLLVKIFINTQTGEIKLFPAAFFKED